MINASSNYMKNDRLIINGIFDMLDISSKTVKNFNIGINLHVNHVRNNIQQNQAMHRQDNYHLQFSRDYSSI